MALFAGNIDDLSTLYIVELRHLLSTEQQIAGALPRLKDAATDQRLKDLLHIDLQEARQQIKRLEQILTELTGDADEKESTTAAALIRETETVAKAANDKAVRDTGMIAGLQQIKHFEMASYTTLRNWARILGYPLQAELLDATLQEEIRADQALAGIAASADQLAGRAA